MPSLHSRISGRTAAESARTPLPQYGRTIFDITAKITFLPKGHNVRSGPIVGRTLGCSIVLEGTLYDVRFELMPGEVIALGDTAVLGGTFSEPVTLAHLSVGKRFTLWDHGALGHGVVLEIGRAVGHAP